MRSSRDMPSSRNMHGSEGAHSSEAWTDLFRGFGCGLTCSGRLICTATAIWLGGTALAVAGPCSAQIAALDREISVAPPGPQSGPTAPQTLGAQLHHQPTPQAVGQAVHIANQDADAALERARRADAANNAADCNEALRAARQLYGFD